MLYRSLDRFPTVKPRSAGIGQSWRPKVTKCARFELESLIYCPPRNSFTRFQSISGAHDAPLRLGYLLDLQGRARSHPCRGRLTWACSPWKLDAILQCSSRSIRPTLKDAQHACTEHRPLSHLLFYSTLSSSDLPCPTPPYRRSCGSQVAGHRERLPPGPPAGGSFD